MKAKEKLEIFYNHSINKAHEEADTMCLEHQAALDRQFAEYQKRQRAIAEEELSAARERVKRDSNRDFSASQLKVKRMQSLKQQELERALFALVEEKLEAFRKTPEYMEFLCSKIQQTKKLAGGSKVQYTVDQKDADLVPELIARNGVVIGLEEIPMLGGIRAVILSRNLLVDYSFASLLQEEKEAFLLQGGFQA